MTVNQRNCCILLYGFLKNQVSCDDISDNTIICGIDTYLQYILIRNKKKASIDLSIQDISFLNPLFYNNERLLLLLDLEIKKLINRNLKKSFDNLISRKDNYLRFIIYLLNRDNSCDNKEIDIDLVNFKGTKYKNKVFS